MKYKFLLVPIVFFALGCGLLSRTISPAPTAQIQATTIPTVTPESSPTVLVTNKPIPTTKAPAENTPTSSGVQMPGFMNNMSNAAQYFNPVGQPVKSWNDIPIMPQAVAAQDWNNGVFSYKANATLNQAVTFYSKFNPSGTFSMPPATGYGGTGQNALHNATYFYSNLLIYMVSYDNDTGHVIVVISK